MLQFESVKIDTQCVSNVVCNCCGSQIPLSSSGRLVDYVSVNKTWGYLSPFDGEKHSFELCSDCYKKIISMFEHPVEIKSENLLV